MGNEMKIKKENVLAAYKATREAGADSTCKVLEELFGKDTFKPEDVTERIKTFEDAMDELNDNHQYVKDYKDWMRIMSYRQWKRIGDDSCKDIVAYLKLRIICAALNEGWEPQFTDDEIRHFPWFYIYTKKELEEMNEVDRNNVIRRAFNPANVSGSLVYGSASISSTHSHSNLGARLAFKSEELAVYAGKQFIDIWANFLF